MAVTFVSSGSASGNVDTLTIASITIVSGDIALVGMMLDAGLTTSTIDYGASTDVFTLFDREVNTGSRTVEIWYADGLSGSAQNIVANLSAKGQNIGGIGMFNGAGTAPDNSIARNADADSSPSSLTVTGDAADNMIFDVISSVGNALIEGADQSVIVNTATGGERGGASYQDGADGGVMTWTWNETAAIAHSACRIPVAVAGGPAVAVFGYHQARITS